MPKKVKFEKTKDGYKVIRKLVKGNRDYRVIIPKPIVDDIGGDEFELYIKKVKA